MTSQQTDDQTHLRKSKSYDEIFDTEYFHFHNRYDFYIFSGVTLSKSAKRTVVWFICDVIAHATDNGARFPLYWRLGAN